MKRTGLSIAGGVALLLASLATGIGGVTFAVAGHAESFMDYAQGQLDQAEKQGNLTPQQQQQLADSRKQMEDAKQKLADPNAKAKMENLKYYGYFEIVAALIGLIGAIMLLMASGAGKAAGLVGAGLGLAACVWGIVLMDVGGIFVQGPFLVLYVLGLAGALSLKPREA